MAQKKQPERRREHSVMGTASSATEAADLADGLREPVRPGDPRQGSRGAMPERATGQDWYDDFGGRRKR